MHPTTEVLSERTANCPSAAAFDYMLEFFNQFEHEQPIARVRLPLRALGLPLPGAIAYPVRLQFGIHIDKTELGRPHQEIPFSWHTGTRFLPDLQGTLRLRIAPHVQTTILLQGAYSPPFGYFGGIFDRILGHHIAQQTMNHLIDRIAQYLENQQRLFLQTHNP